MPNTMNLADGLLLIHNAKDRAAFHADPYCTGIGWVTERVEKTGTPIENFFEEVEFDPDLLLEPDRRFCRVCALEKATLDTFALTRADARDVTCTIGAIPPQDPGSRPRAASDSATERLRRIAAALNLGFVEESKAGGVAYGVVPVRTLPFLERNFRISLPLPGTPMGPGVVATAWSLLTENRHVDEDRWWLAAASVYA